MELLYEMNILWDINSVAFSILTIYGRFIMFSVITNIYNKITKGPTLTELFIATGKLNKFFFDNYRCSICAPWVTRHTLMQYSSSCHTRINIGASIFFTDHSNSEEYRCTHADACGARTWISYRFVPCYLWCTHRTSLVVKKNFFTFPAAVNNSIKVGPLVFLL
jgi:hypothetical protein